MKPKRWMLKAIQLIDKIFEEKGPQTIDYIYSSVLRMAKERRYRELSRGMSEKKLMWLLIHNYRRVDTVKSKKSGNDVVLWGPY